MCAVGGSTGWVPGRLGPGQNLRPALRPPPEKLRPALRLPPEKLRPLLREPPLDRLEEKVERLGALD